MSPEPLLEPDPKLHMNLNRRKEKKDECKILGKSKYLVDFLKENLFVLHFVFSLLTVEGVLVIHAEHECNLSAIMKDERYVETH